MIYSSKIHFTINIITLYSQQWYIPPKSTIHWIQLESALIYSTKMHFTMNTITVSIDISLQNPLYYEFNYNQHWYIPPKSTLLHIQLQSALIYSTKMYFSMNTITISDDIFLQNPLYYEYKYNQHWYIPPKCTLPWI